MATNVTRTLDQGSVELPAPTGGVVAGTLYAIGTGLVGLCKETKAQTLPAAFFVTGVEISYSKATADTWDAGDRIFFDSGSDELTDTSTSNEYVGLAAEAAGAGTGPVKVFLGVGGTPVGG